MRLNMLLGALFIISVFCGCGGSGSNTTTLNDTKVTEQKEKHTRLIEKIISPTSKDRYCQGDDIKIQFEKKAEYDSAHLFVGGVKIDKNVEDDGWVILTNENSVVGRQNVKIELFAGGESDSRTTSFTLLPKNDPKRYRADIVSTKEHSRGAYTQGLEFSQGTLLESSGQYGQSYLAEIEFPSMRELRRKNIDAKYFAEGITVLGGKIYMLTWQENKGLIFDRKTLEQVSEWDYSTEGWGLTNDGKNIYMSDGSRYIYIIDPVTMKSKDRLEVMHSNGELGYINELEWIDGRIWANVYGSNYLYVINPKTGVVEALVDCTELRRRVSGDIDVLNGVALDPASGKIYLTGKLWPSLFEIKLTEAK